MDHALGEVVSAHGSDIDPDVRKFIRGMAAAVARFPGFETAPFPQMRRWAEEARSPWRQGGPPMLETWNLEAPTRHGLVKLRIHRPTAGELPGLVYLHGGGWTLFSLETHDRLMREYASRANCCVIGVDYALSPEQKFPVALEQVVDVVRWLGRESAALGIDAHRLAIGGDSAGGNLSLAAAILLHDLQAEPPLRGLVLNYGAFDTHCSPEACTRYGGPEYMLGCEEMSQYWRNYLRSDADHENPLACPMLASLRDLPPALLVSGECDILGEQSVRMAGRFQAAGVPAKSIVYDGASHSFLEAMSIAAVSNRALDDTADWLRKALGRPQGAGT